MVAPKKHCRETASWTSGIVSKSKSKLILFSHVFTEHKIYPLIPLGALVSSLSNARDIMNTSYLSQNYQAHIWL